MQKSISEESLQASRFKTIRSEDETRHPTTVKKQKSPHKFKRTYHSSRYIQKNKPSPKKTQSLIQSLPLLQSRKIDYINAQNYKKAKQLDAHINRAKSLLNQAQLKHLKKEQLYENKSIKYAYRYQVQTFEHAWSKYFESSREKENRRIMEFSQERKRAINYTRIKLARKCRSLKNRSEEILNLERQERYYKQRGNVEHLTSIKTQKTKIKEKLRKDRENLILRWTHEQSVLINRNQSKRYQVLISRLRQQRKDREREYLKEKSRLKQKFKNVMAQLKHEQKMILNFATMRIEQIKIST